jgi:hypothetical protein
MPEGECNPLTNTSEVLPTFAKSTKLVIRIQEAARDWMVHSGKNLKRVKKIIFAETSERVDGLYWRG